MACHRPLDNKVLWAERSSLRDRGGGPQDYLEAWFDGQTGDDGV